MKRIFVAALAAISLYSSPAEAQQWRCPQWYKLAREVGFTHRDYVTLDAILFRESRCRASAKGYNKRPNGEVWSVDVGLAQVNNYSWISYLRKLGIAQTSDDLLHPRTNLRAAKALYDYSKSKGYSPWHQWRTSSGGSWGK